MSHPSMTDKLEVDAILVVLQASLYAVAGFIIGLFVQVARGEG